MVMLSMLSPYCSTSLLSCTTVQFHQFLAA